DRKNVVGETRGKKRAVVLLIAGDLVGVEKKKPARLRRIDPGRATAWEKSDARIKAVEGSLLRDRGWHVAAAGRFENEPAQAEFVIPVDNSRRRLLQHRQQRRQLRILVDTHIE